MAPITFASRGPMVAPVASGFDSATDAWEAAVVAAGGTVSATQKSRINTLIVGIKADGDWTPLDVLWIYVGESVVKQAAIELKALRVHVIYGSPVFAANGYTGDFSAAIDTVVAMNTGGFNYQLDDFCIGAYVIAQTALMKLSKVELGAIYVIVLCKLE